MKKPDFNDSGVLGTMKRRRKRRRRRINGEREGGGEEKPTKTEEEKAKDVPNAPALTDCR